MGHTKNKFGHEMIIIETDMYTEVHYTIPSTFGYI